MDTATVISENDLRQSISEALQFVSYYHPQDFIEHLFSAYEREEAPAAKNAIAQILQNSRMSALGHRPMCQDTGTANVFLKVGIGVRINSMRSLQEIVDDAVRDAYQAADNPLRASMVRDPLFDRSNTGDNTPGIVHVELVAGNAIEVDVSAKGGGSENKAKFAVLDPGESVSDWVVKTVETLGAGWCPPGILGIGVGGSVEKSMLLAKEALNEPLDMTELRAKGPSTEAEKLRVEIYDRVNALGIGAQGLGGLTSLLDVKLRSFPCHAASLPVSLIPNCAATRHVHFRLDGTGPAHFPAPSLAHWPQIGQMSSEPFRRINLDDLSREMISGWAPGETLLLSGTLYTGRDAAHRRMSNAIARNEALPVNLLNKAIYYVGPVDPVRDEIIGPAGPTTATRMDRYLETVLPNTGLLVMIGKAERSPAALETIAKNRVAYLVAVGGAAYLVAQAIKSARVAAWPDLGMEAIYELKVEDMPVMVAVDTLGNSIHQSGPMLWRGRHKALALT
ncbi:fumarate hydratase [Aminobacter ciceronei]|uniref:Fumarate hydratase class I n=1 Tax=Aminobacter ciceronei TaxID=150723 RepID=A0ABR6CF86_9HYPH|nr:fumarate hydratase [Aminobacter ciceronei]MBA8909932.1 fumarate hydratase class I [Aminobacter ciceronei]MBA9023704.1 fumarate hydratase class I [Aminobacter ciceronei]